jgi:hypothetical protein
MCICFLNCVFNVNDYLSGCFYEPNNDEKDVKKIMERCKKLKNKNQNWYVVWKKTVMDKTNVEMITESEFELAKDAVSRAKILEKEVEEMLSQ